MAARFGSGGARGRRVIGEDAPLYEPAPVAKGVRSAAREARWAYRSLPKSQRRAVQIHGAATAASVAAMPHGYGQGKKARARGDRGAGTAARMAFQPGFTWGYLRGGQQVGKGVVEKIDVDRALALSRSLGSRGKHDAQRRAYQVASRANRRMAGEQQSHLQTRTLQDMESSERQGLGRAGRRRGVTASNLNHAIFARSDAGRSGRSNPWPKYGVGKGLVPMSALKAGAKTVDSALASATPKLKAGAKATVATPKRALATGLAGGAAIGSAGRPAQAQPIYVAPYSQGFGKAYRRYDPERNRQRRAGAAEATLALGGGYAAHRGGRGIIRDSKALRETKIRGEVGSKDTTVGRKLGRSAIAVSRRNGALLGAGVAGIAAAGGVGHWHNSNRGRTYR